MKSWRKAFIFLLLIMLATWSTISATSLSTTAGPWVVSLSLTQPASISTIGPNALTNAVGQQITSYTVKVGTDTTIVIADYKDDLSQTFNAQSNLYAAYSIDPAIKQENIQIKEMTIDRMPGAVALAFSPKYNVNIMVACYLVDSHTIIAFDVESDQTKFLELVNSIHVSRANAQASSTIFQSQGTPSNDLVSAPVSGYDSSLGSSEDAAKITQEDIDLANSVIRSINNELGTLHLPGMGDINLASIGQESVRPIDVFMYSIIKYHHMKKVMPPTSVVDSGIENILKGHDAKDWEGVAARKYWIEYVKTSINPDDLGSRNGMLNDFYMYLKEKQIVSGERINWGFGQIVGADEIRQGPIQDRIKFETDTYGREYESQLESDANRVLLDAEWYISKSEQEIQSDG